MSWAKNMQDASFRGVKFDVKRERTSRQRAISKHEYPYVDGADQEDMGARERRFTLTAAFWGDDYDTRLQAFIKVLDTPGSGELIHPIYGSIPKAQLENHVIAHEADNVDYCEIELYFSESTTSAPFFAQQLKVASVGPLASSASTSGFAAFVSKISAISSAVSAAVGRVQALRNVMNYTLSSLQGMANSVVSGIVDVINSPLSFVSSVSGFLSNISGLYGFAVGTIQTDWKNFFGQMQTAAALPAAINSGTAVVPGATGPVSAGVPDPSGTQGATVAAAANPSDVQVVSAAVQLAVAVQVATTAAGILADENIQPTLAPSDIEMIVNDVRTSINAAISQYRSLYDIVTSRPVTEPLKDTALALQQAAIAVIDQLPALTTRTVNAPANLTLIAFAWYGNYSRADELLRLNPSIRNPNFILAGTVLNAYAS